MADGSVEKNIRFSLEAIDLDKDIEMTDELFRNEDVEEDCALSEKETASFDLFIISLLFYLSYFNSSRKLRASFISFPKLVKLSTILPSYKIYSATFSLNSAYHSHYTMP